MKKNFLLVIGLIVTTSIGAMAQDSNDNDNQNNGKRRLSEEFAQEKASHQKKSRYQLLERISLEDSQLEISRSNTPDSANHPAIQAYVNNLVAIPAVAVNLQDAMNDADDSESESDDSESEDLGTEDALRILQQACDKNK